MRVSISHSSSLWLLSPSSSSHVRFYWVICCFSSVAPSLRISSSVLQMRSFAVGPPCRPGASALRRRNSVRHERRQRSWRTGGEWRGEKKRKKKKGRREQQRKKNRPRRTLRHDCQPDDYQEGFYPKCSISTMRRQMQSLSLPRMLASLSSCSHSLLLLLHCCRCRRCCCCYC